jgi:lantibiotic modifying enzyme
MVSDRWQPLLDGERAVQARAVVLEIVHAIEQQQPSKNPGFKGEASSALLLAHCGRTSACTSLEAAVHGIAAQPSTIALFGGLSGVLWLLDQLGEGAEVDAMVSHLEAGVLRYLHDLMSGLAGVGVYASTRRTRAAIELGESVLTHLEATAIIDHTGATWRTPPQFLPEARRVRFPTGVVDLGVAHGVPGIIGMLARFVSANIARERSARLLQLAVSWLLNATPRARPRFGASWPVDNEERKRIGWCYGDVGVASVLLHAGRALRSLELEQEAVALLQEAAAILATREVPDASFCHGAAGLAHTYNVAFQYTGSPQLRAEAEHWISEILRLRTPGAGIAGYTFLSLDGDFPRWSPDATLLSGVVGVALVLLAAIEDQVPEWQSLFLL